MLVIMVAFQNTIPLWSGQIIFKGQGLWDQGLHGEVIELYRPQKTLKKCDKSVEASPCHSALCHTHAFRMSDRLIRRILHFDLHFHPYEIMVVQELLQHDFIRRHRFTETMLELLTDDIVLIMSDEAYFHLSGMVNKQNFWYWAPETHKNCIKNLCTARY